MGQEPSMKLETAFLDDRALPSWDELVEASDAGTLFQRSAWCQAIAGALDRRFRVIGLFRSGTLAGGCPLFERRAMGMPACDAPFLSGYSGALYNAESPSG